jgi:hypothetical protein
MVTVKHTLPLGEREKETKPILARDRDPSETQRPLGPVHTRNETEYAQRGPCGLRRTIVTVTVICGNNPEGFTFHAPSRQSRNLQQHEAANKCSKRFLSFIYTNLSTVCQLRVRGRPLVVGLTIGIKMKNEPKHSLPDEGEST